MIGEAEFAVAPLLWNRIRELSRADPERGLRERCHDFSMAAGLDADVARQWSLAREVENALWYAAKPRHEGDLARSLWVASTLAGRTLPELPAPHELPAPGEAAGEPPRARTAARRPAQPRSGAPADRRQGVPDSVDGDCHVGVVRAPVADGDPQDVAVLPARTGHPDPAVGDDPRRHRAGGGVVAEGQRDLGVVDVVEHLDAVQRRSCSASCRACSTSPRTWATTPSRPSDFSAAHDRHPAGPAGQFRHGLEGVRRAVRVLDQVAGVQAHGRAQGPGVPDHRDPAVIGHVEGLVRVGAPRIGALQPGGQGGELRDGAAQSPNAPSTWTQAPRAFGDGDCLQERIKGPGVQVPGLQADQQRGRAGSGG